MAITGIPIDENQCIGDSLSIINSAFATLDTRTSSAGSGTVTNVTGTTPIIITGTSTTTPNVTLDAAFIARLTTLENNMNNIGNYPYLEYAWVTAPNAAGQSITANTITTLTLNTEVADTGNFGSVNGTTNRITLAAGTYQYQAQTFLRCSYASGYPMVGRILSLRKNVDTVPVIVSSVTSSYMNEEGSPTALVGQFTISSSTVFDLTILATNSSGTLIIQSGQADTNFTNSTAGADQRTTIKLWKVG